MRRIFSCRLWRSLCRRFEARALPWTSWGQSAPGPFFVGNVSICVTWMHLSYGGVMRFAFLAGLILLAAPAFAAPVFTTLHSFPGEPDGSQPSGALLAADHALYGTTSAGGTYFAGTVYRADPATDKPTDAVFIPGWPGWRLAKRRGRAARRAALRHYAARRRQRRCRYRLFDRSGDRRRNRSHAVSATARMAARPLAPWLRSAMRFMA